MRGVNLNCDKISAKFLTLIFLHWWYHLCLLLRIEEVSQLPSDHYEMLHEGGCS